MTQPDVIVIPRSQSRTSAAALVVCGCALAAAVLGFALVATEAGREAQRADSYQARYVASVSQAKSLGQEVSASPVCQADRPVVDGLDLTDLCRVAERVATAAEPEQVDVEALAASVTRLVLAGLPARIDDAVARYMAAHPQTPAPSRDEVRAWVAAEVAALPPAKDGADGTNGEDGADGQPGPGPTDDQIDAAVSRWFEAHPGNDCPGAWSGPLLDEHGTTYYRCEADQGGG